MTRGGLVGLWGRASGSRAKEAVRARVNNPGVRTASLLVEGGKKERILVGREELYLSGVGTPLLVGRLSAS